MCNRFAQRRADARRAWLPRICIAISVAIVALVFAAPALAEKGKLRERLTPEVMAIVYPAGAERFGPEEGAPPAIAVLKDDKPVAYVFSTLDMWRRPDTRRRPSM
jgi:transcriptional regulator of nitric oxide reductase